MTSAEYQRVCARLASKASQYAARMATDDCPGSITGERAHWIDVFLDEHLPDIEADVLLAVTGHADAFENAAGQPPPSREVAAQHAFQADVWAKIHHNWDTHHAAELAAVDATLRAHTRSQKVKP